MERIIYRKTLDVHKNGTQFLLQGFETADRLSRVIEISLMASGDAIDLPLENLIATMYVFTPKSSEPSINACTIKDNKIVYEVLPIVEEGITTMQLKLIEATPDKPNRIYASPKFEVEVLKSAFTDEDAEQSITFTALEEAISYAKATYDKGCIGITLDSECIFRAHYNDGTYYETDILRKIFLNGNVELSKSYAMGGTGVRAGEDIDNSKYYCNVARSEALNAKDIMENSEEILTDVRKHGSYTAFHVDFESGEVEYVSPSFKFNINSETGELDAEGQTYTFYDEIARLVVEWLESNNIVLSDLQKISSTHSSEISNLQTVAENHKERIGTLEERVTPIEKGGTGATTKEDAIVNLGIDQFQKPWNVDAYVGKISPTSEFLVRSDNSDNSKFGEESYKIYMKNSGQIYFYFTPKVLRDDGNFVLSVCEVEIYNGNIIQKKFIYTQSGTDDEGNKVDGTIKDIYYDHYTTSDINTTQGVLLNVKKNDIITILIKCKSKYMGYSSLFELINISLRANVETPYIYLDLQEGLTTYKEDENMNEEDENMNEEEE